MVGGTCDATPWLIEMGLAFICSDPVWDMDRAHDLINHFTTAFLLATLKDDAEAAAARVGCRCLPGITYEAQGFDRSRGRALECTKRSPGVSSAVNETCNQEITL